MQVLLKNRRYHQGLKVAHLTSTLVFQKIVSVSRIRIIDLYASMTNRHVLCKRHYPLPS